MRPSELSASDIRSLAREIGTIGINLKLYADKTTNIVYQTQHHLAGNFCYNQFWAPRFSFYLTAIEPFPYDVNTADDTVAVFPRGRDSEPLADGRLAAGAAVEMRVSISDSSTITNALEFWVQHLLAEKANERIAD
jgi:hypothetical protein